MNKIPGQSQGDQMARGASPSASGSESNEWIKLCQDAFKRSTTYFDNNIRKRMEDGLRMFNSQHPRDSKYNSDAYKFRSRVFRPKSRSVVRKHEATAAMAFFSNPDVVSVDPVNEDDDDQLTSAQINKELLQYRLTSGAQNGIPWFLTVLGAFQDTMNVGICASFQYWDYKTKVQKKTVEAEMMGQVFEMEVEEEVPVVDKPCCELIQIQNVRFDPAAKWYDVVGTSPYLILQMPMYLRDVLDRMETGYSKDQEPWKRLDTNTLLSARITDSDSTQSQRQDQRQDPRTITGEVNEFDTVMVHLNFIRTEEGVFTYYTLKDTHLLSEPVSIEEVFLHGEIPVTVGFCVLETHQAFPNSLIQLGASLQQEANEIANQRLDNVKLVLNKRYIVRRGSNIDTEALVRNVAGGVSMANDVEKDLKALDWNDVTASSFQEQDRLNADFDDLEGDGLNSSSVMTNRRLNETVGGMKLMAQGANSLTEYTLRLFVETWVEPTLRQIVKLEQYYESDEMVLAIAAQRAGKFQRFQMSPNLDRLLKQQLTLSVNVGMGATDPEARFQRFMQAMGAYTTLSQQAPPDSNLGEIRKELFGLAGFKDSKRFFTQVDPRWAQAQKMLQGAEATAKQIIDQHKDRILRSQMQLERKAVDLDLRELKLDAGMQELENDLMLETQRMMKEFEFEAQNQELERFLSMRKADQEMALKDRKAKQDAALAVFKAKVEARVKEFTAKSQAAIAAKTAASKPKGGKDA